jgi:radical SAM protein with 4Fe4S-binding SPASM domain
MARSVGAEIGVDRVLFKTAQIYDYKDGSDLIPTIDKYARYKEVSPGKWTIKNSLPNHCWRLWNDAVITWDGKVVPCCFDKDAKYVMGDLKEEKFEDIWNGTNYKSFRSSVLDSRASIDICQNCTEGCKVWE